MKWVVVLLVVLVAFVAVGRMGALPGARESAAQTEKNLHDVVAVIEEAAAKADEAQALREGLTPSPEEERWSSARNAACAERTERARRLARPRTMEQIAAFTRAWLAFDQAHDRRVERLRPPAGYAPGARRLGLFEARQERGLLRAAGAADRGDSTAMLAEVGRLRTLAAQANLTLSDLRLTECFFPIAGLPY